jgi:ATP-binding cassette subfamily B multidrug efflux pump
MTSLDRAGTAAAPLTPLRPVLEWSRTLMPYRGAIALLLLCQIAQAIAALTLPTFSAHVIDLGILRHDRRYIAQMGVAMLAAGLAQVTCSVLAAWLGARIAMNVGRDLRSAVFTRVQGFSLHELRKFGTSSLITRTTNDVQQVQAFIAMVLMTIVSAPIMGIGGVIMALRQDVRLSGLLAVSVPVLAVLLGTLMSRAVPLFSRMQGQVDRINQVVREQLAGLRVIRAFVRSEHERVRFGTANDDVTSTALHVGRIMSVNMPAAHLVMQLSGIAMVWLAAPRIAAGTLPVGLLVALLSYIMQILVSVMIASMLFMMAPRALIGARRIREVITTVSSVPEPTAAMTLPTLADGVRVEFRHVTFAYPGALQPVLHDISFTIEPGKTVAVIGATGAGKSTIINLLARLFDVTSGSICINGADIRTLRLESLWALMSIVPQESYLFGGTVASNLRYGDADADDAALWHALDAAQASEFIRDRPAGLAAPVEQGGGNFSGGQRQRLTIARALVRRPAIQLFDDCFSALDYTTDARLQAALAVESAGRTTLLVGQRVTSMRSADTILLLENGTIAASGTHDALLQSSATYREIVESQRDGGMSMGDDA